MKIFRGFQVFEYALWQKSKTRKCRKSTESFLNQKTRIINSYHYQKTAKKLAIWYLSTILPLTLFRMGGAKRPLLPVFPL